MPVVQRFGKWRVMREREFDSGMWHESVWRIGSGEWLERRGRFWHRDEQKNWLEPAWRLEPEGGAVMRRMLRVRAG
jgi:hypothetical protein